MDIELVSYADDELPDALRWQVLSFQRIVWPEGFTGPLRFRDVITGPDQHPHHLLYVAGELVVAHLEIVWRMLGHAGETYKAYGITGVLTFPSFRGEGWAARLVSAATERIDASDGDLGIFSCAPSLEPLYARDGWIPLHDGRFLVGDSPESAVESPVLMLFRAISAKGEVALPSFRSVPVYFGGDTW